MIFRFDQVGGLRTGLERERERTGGERERTGGERERTGVEREQV